MGSAKMAAAVGISARLASPAPEAKLNQTRETASWFPYRNTRELDTNLAMILVILVCALGCVLALNAAVRCLLRRHARSPSRLPATQLVKPVQVAVPAAPVLVFSSGTMLAGTQPECAICLSEFVNGDRVRVLPKCRHGFHEKCIEGWFASNPSCPNCRSTCLAASPVETLDP